MISCCHSKNEGIPENDLLEKWKRYSEQYVTSHSISPAFHAPIQKENNIDDTVNKLYQILKNHLIEKDLIPRNHVLLLADANARIIEILAKEPLPVDLYKEDSEYFDWSIEAIGVNAIGLTAKSCMPSVISGDEHYLQFLKETQTTAVPFCNNHQKLLGVIGYVSYNSDSEEVQNNLKEILAMIDMIRESDQLISLLEKKVQKSEILYHLSKTLYSTFDINEVLSEAIKGIHLLYPNLQLEFLMTQEHLVPDLPIKQMTFIPNKEDISGQAFLEGKVIKSRRKEEIDEIAAPLRGKQGVYGVIHLTCETSCDSDAKVLFISSIADMIGKAFENAKLYQQSIYLVKELQVINELTKRINQSLNKESILQFVIKELLKLFDASYIVVGRIEDEKDILSIMASNHDEDEGKKIPLNFGYMGYVYENKSSIIVSDTESDRNLQDSFLKMIGCRSLIAVPILVHGDIIGILSVSSQFPQHFSYDNLKMMELFAQHLGLALTNAFLHERIQRLAITDYLTQLYNRSYLDGKIKESKNTDSYGSFLLFDIDDFKKINDTYGHQVGDRVLVQVAEILKTSIREEDIASRWGGEELAVYLPSIDTKIAGLIAKRILERIRKETDPQITASCGISAWKKENTAENNISDHDITLVKQADEALYQAKKQGKNRAIIFQ